MLMDPYGRFALIAVAMLMIMTAACTGGDGIAVATRIDLTVAPEPGQTAPAALNPAAPKVMVEGVTPQVSGPAATAVSGSINLPAVMSAEGAVPSPSTIPPTTQNPAFQETPAETNQLQATVAAPAGDIAATSISSLPPAETNPPPATPEQGSEKRVRPVQTSIVVTRSADDLALESTRPVIPVASLPPLATATRRPAIESAATDVAVSEPQHFSDCAARTGGNATVAVPLDASFSGLILQSDDEIAVFTPDGSLCAGSAVWTGQNIALTAWGDDLQTADIDGFSAGDIMQIRFWDASQAREYVAAGVAYTAGDGIYFADSIHVISAVTIEGP